MAIGKLEQLVKKREILNARIAALREDHDAITGTIKAICTHEKTTEHEYYFPGTYNDTAYSEYTNKCDVCNKVLGTRTHNYSWYG